MLKSGSIFIELQACAAETLVVWMIVKTIDAIQVTSGL